MTTKLLKEFHSSISQDLGEARLSVLKQSLLFSLNHCYPFSSNGYAVRTHAIAVGLAQGGVKVIVASRPGLPWDQPGFNDSGFASSHTIEGVRYIHTRAPSERDNAPDQYFAQSVDVYKELIRVFNPSVVMAASNWRNARAPAVAARELGLPFFYEVRGFWELSKATQRPAWAESVEFREEVKQETAIAQAADRVFTINKFNKRS